MTAADSLYRDRTAGRIGALVPASNTNLEPDFALLSPPAVTAHFARIGTYDADVVPDLDAMRAFANESVEFAVTQLLRASVDVIAYGCTSAALCGSPASDREFAADVERLAGVPCVTAAASLVAALRSLGVSRIALISPYVPSLREAAAAFFASEQIAVVSNVGPATELSSAEQGALSPSDTTRLLELGDASDADAVVISCTDLRAVEIIPALESRAERPVVTSNQALMWAALGTLGVETAGMGTFGQLGRHRPPAQPGPEPSERIIAS